MPDKTPFGWVPVPNALFDEWLPNLTGAELRVLLVIVRSTLGWREGNGLGGWRFKRRDWLTNGQFVKRAGSSSAAVSRAIQSLVEKGLVRVENVQGEALDSPGKRRRNMGRMYFTLGPVDMWTTFSPTHNGTSRTTTNRRDNNNGSGTLRAAGGRPAPVRLSAGPIRVGELFTGGVPPDG
jgi:hypothetical protein